LAQAAALWPKIKGPLFASLEARMAERTENLDKLLAERTAKETEDVTRILSELRDAIQAATRRPEQLELDFYGDAEKQQEYVGALERRLHQIPGEIEQETAAVRARYANPRPRLFPVAVTVLIPDTVGDR
jgi:predicted  nucleic acid-binding Zn-ribbon protein